MEKFQELKTLVESLNEDVTKFSEKGNKSAEADVRKSLGEIKTDKQTHSYVHTRTHIGHPYTCVRCKHTSILART